jgi:processive 1,2-diacylglycerol beta-glucosyltransferase
LLLSGDLGTGHRQAALAVKEAALLYRPDIEVELVDFMQLTHPYLHQINRYLFIQAVKTFPNVWGYLFDKTRYDNPLSFLLKKTRFYTLAKVLKLLVEARPSVVVSTFPSAAAAMSALKAQRLTDVPTATIITDHTDHSYWIHPYTDLYVVGSGKVREALNRLGIHDSQISVTGIPVRPQFCRDYDKASLCVKHGIDPSKKTVLVMGGGCGLIGKGLVSLLNSAELPGNLQFIVVCGHNHKLKAQLAEKLQRSPHSIRLTGFVDHIHEYMAASDLIITKPGGLTTAEAVSLAVPLLLYQPLPGQEEDNAAVLTESGVAVQAEDEADLHAELCRLLHSPEKLAAMRDNAVKFGKKQAALDALNAILQTESHASVSFGLAKGAI